MILFIDSVSSRASLNIINKKNIIYTKPIIFSKNNKFSDIIIKKIGNLKKKKLIWDSLSSIVVCNGPGSYTSLRLGIATLVAIHYSLNIPIHTISALDLLKISVERKNLYNTIFFISSNQRQEFVAFFKKNISTFNVYKIDESNILNFKNKKKFTHCVSNESLKKNKINNFFPCIKSIKIFPLNNQIEKLKTFKKHKIISPIYVR